MSTSMSLFTAQLHPGRALGFLVLGASLHDVLTRLKAEPQRFPKMDIVHSTERPVKDPVCILLPQNGMRLRFDGPEQRLRLIEITDFTKNHITFKDRDLVRLTNSTSDPGSPIPGESSSGPTFRHIYQRLLGPTYAGEFIPSSSGRQGMGIYVLSYPGVAFNFPMAASAYSPDKDVVTLLSASSSQVATSMAVFSGESWADARPTLWTEVLPSIKSATVFPRTKDVYPDEVSLVRIHGGGRLQMFRKWTNSGFCIQLGQTTPQDLVMELGAPNAIYRKNDEKMDVHQGRVAGMARGRSDGADVGRTEETMTDTDQSSMNTGSDDSDDELAVNEDSAVNPSGECFYNYFYMGFDVLLSKPTEPSKAAPGQPNELLDPMAVKMHHADRLVATKIVLHGNIPGSYEFNRHGRCRWEIVYPGREDQAVTSEMKFEQVEALMNETWASELLKSKSQARQRGMVLNRGWGNSPGSSCEFLGGWEESGARRAETNSDSTTTLYGFPGLVFEVLKNGYINTVTIF